MFLGEEMRSTFERSTAGLTEHPVSTSAYGTCFFVRETNSQMFDLWSGPPHTPERVHWPSLAFDRKRGLRTTYDYDSADNSHAEDAEGQSCWMGCSVAVRESVEVQKRQLRQHSLHLYFLQILGVPHVHLWTLVKHGLSRRRHDVVPVPQRAMPRHTFSGELVQKQ